MLFSALMCIVSTNAPRVCVCSISLLSSGYERQWSLAPIVLHLAWLYQPAALLSLQKQSKSDSKLCPMHSTPCSFQGRTLFHAHEYHEYNAWWQCAPVIMGPKHIASSWEWQSCLIIFAATGRNVPSHAPACGLCAPFVHGCMPCALLEIWRCYMAAKRHSFQRRQQLAVQNYD